MEMTQCKPGNAVITVNGMTHLAETTLSYIDILNIVGHAGDARLFTVTYRNAHLNKSGILAPSEFVEVCDGTVFDVSYTGDA